MKLFVHNNFKIEKTRVYDEENQELVILINFDLEKSYYLNIEEQKKPQLSLRYPKKTNFDLEINYPFEEKPKSKPRKSEDIRYETSEKEVIVEAISSFYIQYGKETLLEKVVIDLKDTSLKDQKNSILDEIIELNRAFIYDLVRILEYRSEIL